MNGTQYNRLPVLTDGVFALAMTLLVLDLRVPGLEAVGIEAELREALREQAPRLGVYLMSFLVLGLAWMGQQRQLEHLARTDRTLAWLHLALLFLVALLPFSSNLLAEFQGLRTALLAYWLHLLLLGLLQLTAWGYIRHAGLMMQAEAGLPRREQRRILLMQCLQALAALLCVFGTGPALAALLLVQLAGVLAPRLGSLGRL